MLKKFDGMTVKQYAKLQTEAFNQYDLIEKENLESMRSICKALSEVKRHKENGTRPIDFDQFLKEL